MHLKRNQKQTNKQKSFNFIIIYSYIISFIVLLCFYEFSSSTGYIGGLSLAIYFVEIIYIYKLQAAI